MTTAGITDSYEDTLTLIADAVHRTDHRSDEALALLRRIDGRLAALEADWAAFKPMAEAYQRGGLLAMRSAARAGRNGHG